MNSKNLETFDSIYFCGKSHFEDEGTQNILKRLVTIMIIFYHADLKDCLMKALSLLLHLLILLIIY